MQQLGKVTACYGNSESIAVIKYLVTRLIWVK